MSYALIESELGEGRYRVKLDYGEAQRQALIAANEQALAQITYKMEVAREAVLVAEINEAAARESIKQIIDQIVIVSTDAALLAPLQALLNDAKLRYAKLVASNSPVRRQFETLKATHANGVQRRIRWNALQTIEYKDAWCADYTLEAGGYVATIDIPGDPSLTLLAPGCRPWQRGDGTISTARKSGNIAILQAQMKPLTDEAGEIRDTLIPQAVTQESALLVLRNLALEAVQVNPSQANRDTLEKASQRLDEQRDVLKRLRERESVLSMQIAAIDLQLAQWNNRAASESPNYGDGRYLTRDLCSPEQTFFNAAISPGWQKFKPTYRWGTISYINYDDNLANVALGSASTMASGQRIDVNQSQYLNGIQFQYMGCDARAFSNAENVIIKFSSQRWEEPVIVGYLDNPKPCPPIFYGDYDGETFIPETILYKNINSLDLSDYFSGGAEPLNFSVVNGSLPEHVVLDSSSGELRAIGSTTETVMTPITIRCEDRFYAEGNRRFAESNEFLIGVGGGYFDVDGFAHGDQFPPEGALAGSGTIPNGSAGMYMLGGNVTFSASFYFANFDYQTGTSSGVVVWRDANAYTYPNYYIRRTHLSGDPILDNGIDENVWIATTFSTPNSAVEWYTSGSLYFDEAGSTRSHVGPPKAGTYKFEIAHAPSDAAILSTITGTFSIAGMG